MDIAENKPQRIMQESDEKLLYLLMKMLFIKQQEHHAATDLAAHPLRHRAPGFNARKKFNPKQLSSNSRDPAGLPEAVPNGPEQNI